jgi:predicted helicase
LSENTENIINALRTSRDEEFARLFILWIGIAAEKNPDLLQKALAQVFDLSAIVETATRAMLVVSKAQEAAERCRAEIRELEERLTKAAKYAAQLNGTTK